MRFCISLMLVLVCMTACGYEITPVISAIPSGTQESTITKEQTPTLKPAELPTGTSTPNLPWYTRVMNDPALLGRQYAQLKANNLPVYNTLEDAVAGAESHFHAPSIPAYIAFDELQRMDGSDYLHLTSGGWMLASDVTLVDVTAFSGVLILQPPSLPFGWVLQDTSSLSFSGKAENSTTFSRYQLITVYESREQDGTPYIRAGEGAWIPAALVSQATINKDIPIGNTNCRWIDVNLSQQNLVVYENCQPVFATLISSAKSPAITPEGTFTVFYTEPSLPLFSNESVVAEPFYLQDVPCLLFFHKNWAIHGAYWHDHFGEVWSHGCINVSPYDARWLFEWATYGDMIVVHR